jgi:hypothetical protein
MSLASSSRKSFSSSLYVLMTSFSVQKRAKPQPTHAVCLSRKNLTALGVDFKMLSTLVSETSKSLHIMDIEYRFPPNVSLLWRKQ